MSLQNTSTLDFGGTAMLDCQPRSILIKLFRSFFGWSQWPVC